MDKDYLLAIDTANQTCSVALAPLDDSGACRTVSRLVGNRHVEFLLGMIDEMLSTAGIGKGRIGLVAFGRGPGSFTGLRVACGMAQGFAWGFGVQLAQISNLEAAAQALATAHNLPDGMRIAVVNDARMHEIYAGVFVSRGPGRRVETALEATLVKPAALGDWLREERAATVAGSALTEYAADITLPEGIRTLPEPGGDELVAAMSTLALLDRDAGGLVSPELAAPLYIRDRVALTIDQRARGEKL